MRTPNKFQLFTSLLWLLFASNAVSYETLKNAFSENILIGKQNLEDTILFLASNVKDPLIASKHFRIIHVPWPLLSIDFLI